jgi:hypothetical protein
MFVIVPIADALPALPDGVPLMKNDTVPPVNVAATCCHTPVVSMAPVVR